LSAASRAVVYCFSCLVEAVGCCTQDLDVYRVTPQGVSKLLHQASFSLTKPLQGSGIGSIEGRTGLAEEVGSSAPNAVRAQTYVPVFVIMLGDSVRLDSLSSASRTRDLLGGFAGLENRSDIVAVVDRDSARFLWNETEHRRIE
jgi:hypothetical protein